MVRYFMSDSIIEWLNTEKPSIGETVKKLGTDFEKVAVSEDLF